MAKSVDERYEEIYNLGINEHNKNKETKKQTAQNDKQIINANADANIKNITNNYNTQIADTNKSYENAFQQNELQVKLNERHLERKAAEMGLTDSGLNRTQLTANQLSYANQKGEISRQKQKAVDTLAATMRSKITEVNTNRNNQIAQIDSALNNDLAQMDLDYASAARQQATDIYNAEYKAEQEREAERIKAEQANENKYINVYDDKGNVINKYTNDEKKQNLSDLKTFINSKTHTANEKMAQIYNYITKYNPTELETLNLLSEAELTYGDLESYYYNATNNIGATLRVSPKEYNKKYMEGDVGNVYVDPSDWDYKTNGTLRYNFVITKATNNWGKGIDYNDRVSISYPDGTPIKNAQNIQIKDLPENIQQDITNRTAGKKKDDTFYYSCDLKGLKK